MTQIGLGAILEALVRVFTVGQPIDFPPALFPTRKDDVAAEFAQSFSYAQDTCGGSIPLGKTE